MERVFYLREQPKPSKHISFDPDGAYVTVSCTDGLIYIYSFGSEEPELLKKVSGIIPALETEDQAGCATAWHPDGRAFAAPTAAQGA